MRRLAGSIIPVVIATLFGANVLLAADEADALWKSVRRLDSGTRITISINGAAPVERYFVQVDDTDLVVLNLSDANLPKRQLLNMAKDNPAWIARTSNTTYKDSSLRIGPDGVFLKDQKVADLNQVVEHIPRSRVTSVAKGSAAKG